MAIQYQKKAGQWSKMKANRLWDRAFTTLVISSVLTGVGIGLNVAYLSLFSIIVVPLFLAGVYFSLEKMRKINEGWTKDRIRYMRGAQAEGLIAWILQGFPDEWHIFHNLPRARGGDIDHIAIGPEGLFVISTKSYKGHVIRETNGRLRLNGKSFDNDLDEALSLALFVRDRLKSTIGNQTPWVQPVLALPFAKMDVPPKESNVWIVDDLELKDAIASADSKATKLSKTKIELIIKELQAMAPND